jgi:hypothetical protein
MDSFVDNLTELLTNTVMRQVDDQIKTLVKKIVDDRLQSEEDILKVWNTINDDFKTRKSNKGTGAGGSKTNLNGKSFEEKTFYEKKLLEQGFIQEQYYLSKTYPDKRIVVLTQHQFWRYMKEIYHIEQSDLFRIPDEAYVIEYNDGRREIKILEKKNQNVGGSVDIKLWAGPSLKREYELIFGEFQIQYGFCLSSFLQGDMTSSRKKYKILNVILNESHIKVMFGDEPNYFETLFEWINSS